MKRHILWVLSAALVLALAGGAAASSGKRTGRTSGHAPPASRLAHPPIPPALLKALTRKHLKARNTTGKTSGAAHRTGTHSAVTRHNTATVAAGLGNAIASASVQAGTATFVTVPTNGTPDAVSDPSFTPAGFPSDGTTFAILTNGDATQASQPHDPANPGTSDSCTPGAGCGGDGDPTSKGSNRQAAHDVTILKIPLTVPKNGGNCLSFDFRYLSQEYPGWVSSPYNDAFVAELDKNTWTATGANASAPISAPANFAADIGGKPISTNAAATLQMSAGAAAGTTYGGATPLLRASTPVTPGSHTLYLSIFDQNDHFYDSAAFVDDLRLTTEAAGQCLTGAVVDEAPADVSVVGKATLSGSNADYTITAHNDGPAAAENVTVTDSLYFNLNYVGSDGAECTYDGEIDVTCSLGELAPGATTQFTLHTTVADTTSDFANGDNIASSTYDPVPGNNWSSSDDYGGGSAPPPSTPEDLSIAASAPDTAQGQLVKIPVTITNNGPGDFSDGFFTDTQVPKSISFIGWSLPDGAAMPDQFDGCYAFVAGDMSCSMESGYTLANGASFEVDLYGYVLRSGWINTESDLWLSTEDSNYTNNYAFAAFNAAPTQYQAADINLTQTVPGDFAQPGGTLTYTIKATNAGPAEATDVEVYDQVPFESTGTSVSDTLGSCTSLAGDGTLDCHIDLKPGKTDTISYTTTIDGGASPGDFVFNVASVQPTNYFDPNLDDNYWYAFTEVANSGPETADLSSKVTTSPTAVTAGSPVTSTGTITNKGPSGVSDAVLSFSSDTLNSSFVPAMPSGCSWSDYGGIDCDVGALAKGASKTVKLVWVPEFGADDVVFTTPWSPDLTWEDPAWANNQGSAKLTVTQPVVDLGISIVDAVDPVVTGANETYTISVTNPNDKGGDAATGVQVVDALPAGETLVSASGKGFTCVQAAVITCTLKGTLPAASTATITLVVAMSASGDAVDTASVTATSLDLDPTDNTASVLTAVGSS